MCEAVRVRDREEGGERKNTQWICQLAFLSEKVIHLTAAEMSWENKRMEETRGFAAWLASSVRQCVFMYGFSILFGIVPLIPGLCFTASRIHERVQVSLVCSTRLLLGGGCLGALIHKDSPVYCDLPPVVCYWLRRRASSNELGEGICLWPPAQMTLLSLLHFRKEGSMFMSVWRKRGKKEDGGLLFTGFWTTNTYTMCANTYALGRIGNTASERHKYKYMHIYWEKERERPGADSRKQKKMGYMTRLLEMECDLNDSEEEKRVGGE